MRHDKTMASRLRADPHQIADEVRRQARFERHIVEVQGRAPKTGERREVDRVRPLAGVRAVLILLLALYGVWAPMLKVTPMQGWTLYAVALAIGAALLVVGTWRRPALITLALLIANWAVLWATHRWWSAWDGTHTRAVQEAYAMRSCALNSTAIALLAGVGRLGVRSIRLAWATVGASLLVMAAGEVVTGDHFSPFVAYAAPRFSPAGPFGNPNNLACILVVILGIILGRMSERISHAGRTLLAVVALLTVVLIGLTLSRAALLAAAAVALAAALLAATRSERGQRILHPPRTGVRLKGLVTAASLAAIVAAGTGIWHLITPTDDAQARSDGLRFTLVRLALRYWRESPWLGIGGGRFEILLKREHPEVGYVLPVHNTFVEYLAEYGLVGAGSLFLLLLVAIVTIARIPRYPDAIHAGRPRSLDDAGVRYLAFVMLVGIVLAGVVMSSALNWQPWWLMIATLAVLTGRLLDRRAALQRGVSVGGS